MLTIKSPLQLTARRPRIFCRDYLPLQESSVQMLFAGGGVGKSFAAIRECIEFVRETERKAVLWLTEDSEGETRRRYERIIEMHKVDRTLYDSRIMFIAQEPVRFTRLRDGNAELTPEFYEIRLALIDYSLIVLDPLLQFQGCDENSNTHAGVLMGGLKAWAGDEGKVILLVHHASRVQGSENIRARGAGEWVNGTRGVYEISRCEEKSKKDRRVFKLVKDNGLSYYFRNPLTGEAVRELDVFPPWEEEQDREEKPDLIVMSFADHNDAKIPTGFQRSEIMFSQLHQAVTRGRAYSPYVFANGHRKSENNLGGATVLCLDFDDGVGIDWAKKRFASYESCIVTTRSHQKDGNGDRFRVFLRLAEPLEVPVEDHADFMGALFEKIGHVDPATKDPARFFFASPADAYFHYSTSARPFDWRPTWEEVKKQKTIQKLQQARKVVAPKSANGKEPQNTLPESEEFITKSGEVMSFASFRSYLAHNGKEQVRCRHGIDHSGEDPARNIAAFIKKADNGNVYYHCSGGRCEGEGTLWCAGWNN